VTCLAPAHATSSILRRRGGAPSGETAAPGRRPARFARPRTAYRPAIGPFRPHGWGLPGCKDGDRAAGSRRVQTSFQERTPMTFTRKLAMFAAMVAVAAAASVGALQGE